MTDIDDPIAFELFKNAIFSIADEMALTICRTTYSGVLRDNMDFSTAFADAEGRLVAQGLTLPGHLGSIPTALATVVERFRDDIHPGDVFCLNDPFDGGMHLPDIFVFQPIFHEGRRLAFACTICHHTDVGGRVAGSNASDSTEIYQEGLRIPPLKMFERGKRNETLWTLIESNVRVPVRLAGDLRGPARGLPYRGGGLPRPRGEIRRGARRCLYGGGDRLCRAADPRRALRAAGRDLVFRGLDRR